MAWIYLAESEESHTPSRNGSDQSPIAKLIPTVKAYCSQDFEIKASLLPQYGLILERLGCLEKSERLQISSTEDSLVRTSALPAWEKAWKESEAVFFSKSCAWPKKSSPNFYSLRTYQLLRAEEDSKLSSKLPRWGMIVDGVLYPLRGSELYTDVKDGSYLATPTASQASKPIRSPSPSRKNSKHGEDLQDSIGRLNPEMIGKKLSPVFVELMMGFPMGWTDCAPLETPLYRNRFAKHGKF